MKLRSCLVLVIVAAAAGLSACTERTEARRDTRAGSYRRKLGTQAGEVTLKVPKLRQQTFETAIIERYRRRESSVEEALIDRDVPGGGVG